MTSHERGWNDRPFDVSNLLNPAFIGVILRRAADGFYKERELGLPFAVAFLVPPLVLHRNTRELLPKSVATKVQPWLFEHRQVLINFGKRCTELVPFTREALMFCLIRDVINLDESGVLVPGGSRLRGVAKYEASSPEIKDILRRAEFVGRWLTSAGPTSNLFASLGVSP